MKDTQGCAAGSVGGCGPFLWWSDSTADSDACCPIRSCGTANSATVSPRNMSQESRALRDSTAICHRPAGRTGHLDLQVNGSNVKTSDSFKTFKSTAIKHVTSSLSADLLSSSWHSRDGAWQHTACDVIPSFTTQPFPLS